MLERKYSPDFRDLCAKASHLMAAYGYMNLAVEFILCDNDQIFKRLCYSLEEYGGGNPLGDALEGLLMEIKQIDSIVNVLDSDQGV